jgi:hypothetical protein
VTLLKYLLSIALYFIGDLISRTFMTWGRGYGYSIYRQLMLWSCDLDKEGKIWKYPDEEEKK